MSELIFKSSLSADEIEHNFNNTDLYSGLLEGLNEALAHANGNPSANTLIRKASLPSVDVAKIRKSLSMTQKGFADVLGVSCRTVEAWETGKTNPTPTAKKLMHLIEQDHSIIQKL